VSVCTVKHITNSVPLESTLKILNRAVSRGVARVGWTNVAAVPGGRVERGGQNGYQN